MSGIGKKSKLSGAQNKKNRLQREDARQKLSGSLDKFTIKTINPTTTATEENKTWISKHKVLLVYPQTLQ